MARDPYEVVLADLRAKRDELDKLIRTLTAFRHPQTPTDAPLPGGSAPGTYKVVSEGGPFEGLSIVDAAIRVLRDRGKPIRNAELAEAIQDGGVVMNSVEPANTVSSVLHRARVNGSPIARVSRGVWGLAEWTPARPKETDDTPPDPNTVDILS